MTQNFLKRNKPIFAIGILLAIIFVVITFLSRKNPSGISLIENVGDIFDDEKEVVFNPNNDITGSNAYVAEAEETTETTSGIVSTATTILQTPEVLEITFTSDGFLPSTANAAKGQVVTWKNGTAAEIVIKELIKKHEEFASGVAIAPGASFELKLYGTKLWTFEEVGSGKIGRLYIAGSAQ